VKVLKKGFAAREDAEKLRNELLAKAAKKAKKAAKKDEKEAKTEKKDAEKDEKIDEPQKDEE